MQIRRFSLDISQNLHPAIYYINLMSQEFLLHRSIKLRRIPCCLIKILSKLIFKIFLKFPKLFLIGNFFEFPYVSTFCKECHILQKIKILIEIQRKTELVSETNILIRRFQTILCMKYVHNFLKFKNIKIDNDSSFLPSIPFLFLNFMQKQRIEILFLQIIQSENSLIIQTDVSLR